MYIFTVNLYGNEALPIEIKLSEKKQKLLRKVWKVKTKKQVQKFFQTLTEDMFEGEFKRSYSKLKEAFEKDFDILIDEEATFTIIMGNLFTQGQRIKEINPLLTTGLFVPKGTTKEDAHKALILMTGGAYE